MLSSALRKKSKMALKTILKLPEITGKAVLGILTEITYPLILIFISFLLLLFIRIF